MPSLPAAYPMKSFTRARSQWWLCRDTTPVQLERVRLHVAPTRTAQRPAGGRLPRKLNSRRSIRGGKLHPLLRVVSDRSHNSTEMKPRAAETPFLSGNLSHAVGVKPKLLSPARLEDPLAAAKFLASVLEASTEYSVIGKSLEGTIELWNEGARRLYGFGREA